MTLKDLNIDKSWSLFLDRDGVINKRIVDNYVTTWAEFEFLPGVIDSISSLSYIFGHIFIVTNQQGIGKRVMSESDLQLIHSGMVEAITKANGRIDRIYFSPYLEKENNQMRKPSPGMGLLAKKEFPELSFNKSIMVGDSVSDMQFGKNCGMTNVFIGEHNELSNMDIQLMDFYYKSLPDFSSDLLMTD